MGDSFFVIGNPRSGTTLLRLLLAAHPALVVPPECGFAVWLRQRFGDWTAADTQNPKRRGDFLAAVAGCRKFDTWELPIEQVASRIQTDLPESYAGLAACVYWAYRDRYKPDARRWGDKNNFHVQHVDELAALFPGSRFIHIVRDVRDVACSYLEIGRLNSSNPYSPKLPVDIDRIGADWGANVTAVQEAFVRLSNERTWTVRYEDLVVDPSASLRALCDFLGEPFDLAMLDFYRQGLEPKQLMEWKQRTATPVSSDRVGRFRDELQKEQAERLTAVCRDLLQMYRYEV